MIRKVSILGCGWLGQAIATDFINKAYKVKASVTSYEKAKSLETNKLEVFIIRMDELKSNINDFLLSDLLIIAMPPQRVSNYTDLLSQIVKSTVKYVLFISSTSVYENSEEIITEYSPVKESVLSKAESLFLDQKNFQSSIIRFGGLFGYNRKPGNFIPEGKQMDNPEGFVNLIHRDDCILIIRKIIEINLWGEILNACADTHPTRRSFYTKEANKLGKEAPEFNEFSDNTYKIISNKKLKTLLNYKFKYPDLMNYE